MLKKFKGIGLLILSNLLISITLYIVFQLLASVVLPGRTAVGSLLVKWMVPAYAVAVLPNGSTARTL